MRIEATIPDGRAASLGEAAQQLGITRSQVIDEALALYLTALLEVRAGRRLVSTDPTRAERDRELVVASLASLRWAQAMAPATNAGDEAKGAAR